MVKSTHRNSLGLFDRVILLINHIASIALLFSYLSPFISPSAVTFVAFFGLFYPVLLVINLVFIFYWILRLKRQFLYSTLIIAVGFSQLLGYVRLGEDSERIENGKQSIKIMSYNVRLFDLYDWGKSAVSSGDFFKLIKAENPNIICLQEFYSNDGSSHNNVDTLKYLLNSKFVHTQQYHNNGNGRKLKGGAIFSTYPIINSGSISVGMHSNKFCIFSDIVTNLDTIRVYNVHLQSIKFNNIDYDYVDELISSESTDEIEKTKGIYQRLNFAYSQRAQQAELLAAHINKSPYPVLVCGDFNDTYASYSYHTISRNLKDGFIESGKGLGVTYAGKFPALRIDYILFSKSYESSDFRTINKKLSDHYPLVCNLRKL